MGNLSQSLHGKKKIKGLEAARYSVYHVVLTWAIMPDQLVTHVLETFHNQKKPEKRVNKIY